ncbi:hypothetical protein HKX48_006173 [Thoreauomyces humboldtii]|nr:hypothetical protein HKX48_006173 [Thoreauomyces humboldtii]
MTTDVEDARRRPSPPPGLVLCTAETFPAFLSFAAAHNSLPSQYCLHLDRTVDAIRNDLVSNESDPLQTWWAHLDDDGSLKAVLGYDVEEARETGALHGPWGRDMKACGDVLRDVMIAAPKVVKEFIAFMSLEAGPVIQVLEEAGFTKRSIWTTLELDTRGSAGGGGDVDVGDPVPKPTADVADEGGSGGNVKLVIPRDMPSELNAVLDLHYVCFPKPTLDRSKIATFDGVDKWVFGFFSPSSSLLGYSIVCKEADTPKAYVEYVGVAPDARGKGHGTALLGAVKEWFKMERPDIQCLRLNVNNENANAKRLYLSAGFTVTEEGHAMRCPRAP